MVFILQDEVCLITGRVCKSVSQKNENVEKASAWICQSKRRLNADYLLALLKQPFHHGYTVIRIVEGRYPYLRQIP